MSAGNPISPSPALPLVYAGVSVTLSTTGKSLLALIKALGGEYAAVLAMCSELTIQCDQGSADSVIVCDSIQAATASPPTSYGYALNLGQSKTYPNGADLSRIYAASSAGAATLNIEVNNGCSTRW
jgi:hypothetical protein